MSTQNSSVNPAIPVRVIRQLVYRLHAVEGHKGSPQVCKEIVCGFALTVAEKMKAGEEITVPEEIRL